MNHEETRIAVGALALGALDEDEAAEVRAHLETCADCRREYDELSGLPALLGLVPAAEVIAGPAVASEAGSDRLLAAVAAERKAKQRRGLASRFAGALALAAAASVIGFVVAEGSAEPTEQADFTVVGEEAATGVWALVNLDEVGWGTRIELQLSGVSVGESCRLIAVYDSGVEVDASNWTVPDSDNDYITIPGAVGAHPGEIDHFNVLGHEGEVLVTISLDEATTAPSSD